MNGVRFQTNGHPIGNGVNGHQFGNGVNGHSNECNVDFGRGTNNGHNGATNGHSKNGISTNGHCRDERDDDVGNSFLKKLVDIIIEETGIVGHPTYVRRMNPNLVDFKQPKDLEALLKLDITRNGLTEDALLDLCHKVIKHSVKTTHPHFYNQLYAGIDEYSLAGSWLTEALNTSQATYEISPVFTLMERNVIKYLGQFCNWPRDDIDGIFSPGGSMANIYAMVLARHKMFPDTKRTGIRNLSELVVFVSEDSHYSFDKGSIWLGMGTDAVVKIKTDAVGRMDPVALEVEIEMAKQSGRIPFIVACTAGTTVLGAFDPLNEVGQVCERHGLWMHVDAALGGTLLLSTSYRHLLHGIRRADSVAWNLHKIGGVPLQCSAFLTRHPHLLSDCNSLSAEYLFQNDKYYDASYDSGDKSIQCGRKVDSLKLWFALAARGQRNMERLVDNVMQMSRYVAGKMRTRPGFHLVLPEFQCNNICFWYVPKRLRTADGTLPTDAMELHRVAPLIKGRMMENGNLMINYQPLSSKNLPNFFRLTLTCLPAATKVDMDFVIDEIDRLGADL